MADWGQPDDPYEPRGGSYRRRSGWDGYGDPHQDEKPDADAVEGGVAKLLTSLVGVLAKGRMAGNPVILKQIQGIASTVAALVGLAAALGVDVSLMSVKVFGGLVFLALLVNAYITYASSEKVGILPVKADRSSTPVMKE